MERLTQKSDKMIWFKDQGLKIEPCEMNAHHYRMILEKLAAYEDAEEQGLLVRLPCKVGNTIWDIDTGRPEPYKITGIKIDKGIIAESIQHYGKNNQSTVCMEECAELIQAISKAKRGKINRDNMIEEIADVLICIEMLKQMYMISDEKINKWIEKKQAREAERMEKND